MEGAAFTVDFILCPLDHQPISTPTSHQPNHQQLVVELSHKEGLVLPSQQGSSALRGLISSLLLRLDALASSSLINEEQLAVLRNKAWAQDFGLVRAYDSVSRGVSGGVGVGVGWGSCSVCHYRKLSTY